jgi:hypothetical protein
MAGTIFQGDQPLTPESCEVAGGHDGAFVAGEANRRGTILPIKGMENLDAGGGGDPPGEMSHNFVIPNAAAHAAITAMSERIVNCQTPEAGSGPVGHSDATRVPSGR